MSKYPILSKKKHTQYAKYQEVSRTRLLNEQPLSMILLRTNTQTNSTIATDLKVLTTKTLPND